MFRFEWDPFKDRRNTQKHGVTFELASSVFYDRLAIIVFDRIVRGEPRWRAIGRAGLDKVFVVVHTVRDVRDVEIIRIISARRASRHEQLLYVQQAFEKETYETALETRR